MVSGLTFEQLFYAGSGQGLTYMWEVTCLSESTCMMGGESASASIPDDPGL